MKLSFAVLFKLDEIIRLVMFILNEILRGFTLMWMFICLKYFWLIMDLHVCCNKTLWIFVFFSGRKEKRLSSISVAHFTVDSKSSKELQQYLSNIVSHCEQGSDRLPSVIVIDNLHLADNLSKAFSGFFSLSSQLW